MFSKYDPEECARYNEIHLSMGSIHCPCQVIEIPGTSFATNLESDPGSSQQVAFVSGINKNFP